MAEIRINITELNNAIVKLQTLQSKCISSNTAAPATVGGGKTVNELEAIANLYKTMNIEFGTLVSNTAFFLQNVRDSYISSDQKAAQGIGSSGSYGGGAGGGAFR